MRPRSHSPSAADAFAFSSLDCRRTSSLTGPSRGRLSRPQSAKDNCEDGSGSVSHEWQLARTIILPGSDFRLGCLCGLAVLLASLFDDSLRRAHLLDVSIAVGLATLAVVAAITAIFATFVDDEYVTLLQTALGTTDDASYPYKSVAYASAFTTIVSGIGLFAWPASLASVKAVALGISLGAAVWSVTGTAQLVSITARHGYWRRRLPELREAYKEERERRKAS